MRQHFIVLIYVVHRHETGSYIVTEWIPNGDLTNLLRTEKVISWYTRAGYAKDTAAAMAYLHARNVIHRYISLPLGRLDKPNSFKHQYQKRSQIRKLTVNK